MRTLLMVGAAVLLFPATVLIAFASLSPPDAIIITACALGAHLTLFGLCRRTTMTLLIISALVAVQGIITGLFVLFPSTLLVLPSLHGAAARGNRYAASTVAVLGPLAAAARYAIDPSIVDSEFGPEPWLLALLLLAGCAVAVTLGLLRRAELRTVELTAAQLDLEQRERSHREARAAADERARISRDLHDVLAHSLTVIVGQVRVARFQAEDSAAALQVIEETARESLRDLRGTLQSLRDPDADTRWRTGTDVGSPSPAWDVPLQPTPSLSGLPALAARMQDLGLVVHRRTEGRIRPLGSAAELALYRFVQEGLTNALRHGEGPVEWRETWGQDCAMITLRNAVPAVDRGSDGLGMGLQGMRERLTAVSGVLTVDRASGFAVTASVPYVEKRASGDRA